MSNAILIQDLRILASFCLIFLSLYMALRTKFRKRKSKNVKSVILVATDLTTKQDIIYQQFLLFD